MISGLLTAGSVIGGLAKTVFSSGGRQWLKDIFGSQSERERYQYQMTRGAQDQLAAEFRNLARRTWADVLADVLNRFPRPLFAYQYLLLPLWLIVWPESFAAAMLRLSSMPGELWWIYSGVVGFYFGFRALDKMKSPKFNAEKFEQAQKAAAAIEAKAASRVDLEAELEDRDEPMSNQAIMQWNRRRQIEAERAAQ